MKNYSVRLISRAIEGLLELIDIEEGKAKEETLISSEAKECLDHLYVIREQMFEMGDEAGEEEHVSAEPAVVAIPASEALEITNRKAAMRHKKTLTTGILECIYAGIKQSAKHGGNSYDYSNPELNDDRVMEIVVWHLKKNGYLVGVYEDQLFITWSEGKTYTSYIGGV